MRRRRRRRRTRTLFRILKARGDLQSGWRTSSSSTVRVSRSPRPEQHSFVLSRSLSLTHSTRTHTQSLARVIEIACTYILTHSLSLTLSHTRTRQPTSSSCNRISTNRTLWDGFPPTGRVFTTPDEFPPNGRVSTNRTSFHCPGRVSTNG